MSKTKLLTRIWIFFCYLFITLPNIFSYNEFSSVVTPRLSYLHFVSYNTNYYFSSLINNFSNLMFAISSQNENIKIIFGDIWVNFGRGLVFGDTKYNYFIKYGYLSKYLTNDIYGFNNNSCDRNYDSIVDVRKGVGLKVQNQIITSFFIFPSLTSYDYYLFGGIVEIDNFGVMFAKYDNIFSSFNFKSKNLLGAGLVSDLELFAICSTNLEFSLGGGGFFEWYYKDLEFSLEFKISDSKLPLPFSYSFYSIYPVKGGIIFSSKLNRKNVKFNYISKVSMETNGSWYSDIFFFGSHNIFTYTFADIEFLKDSIQGKTFISLYPFVKFDFLSFYSKPYWVLGSGFNKLEIGSYLSFPNFKVKGVIFFPFNKEGYTFISSEVRDIFGENIDIKISNSDGISGVLGLLFSYEKLKLETFVSLSEFSGIKFFGVFYLKIQ